MLGRLHLLGLSLAAGAMGLFWFYGRTVTAVPRWIIWVVLLLPWLTVHTITFCNAPPFGPKPFRRCLLAAVFGYASLAVGAEVIQLVHRLPADGSFPVAAARALMYAGCLGCIPLSRAYLSLRSLEAEGAPPDASADPGPA